MIALVRSGATHSRRQGLTAIALVAIGFAVGQVLGVASDAVARTLMHDRRSLTTLAQLPSPPWWFIAASLVGLWIGFGAAVVVAARTLHVLDRGTFLVKARDAGYVVVGVLLQLAVDVLYSAAHLYSHYKGNSSKIFSGATGHGFLVLALMTIVGAPIFEELLFRGVLLDGLRSAISRSRGLASLVLGVVLDGLLFAAAHAQWEAFAGLALTGMVLALIYARTRRIVPCILTHASFNAVAVFAVLASR